MVKTTERGWAAHFICADRCMFRRNTLVEGELDAVVISTVGCMRSSKGDKIEPIGAFGRYYETMAFGVALDGPYKDVDVSDERTFETSGSICAKSFKELPEDVDNVANNMHDAVVAEFATRLTL